MDPQRRSLLTGALLGRRAGARPQPPRGPRPPTALADGGACARCEARPCAEACPEGIILWDETGRAPYLDFAIGGCTFCGECARACPETGEGPRRALGTVVLDQDRCMAWNGVVCMSCLFRCPERAISADGRHRPAVQDDPCTGCGACVSACPAAALAVTPT